MRGKWAVSITSVYIKGLFHEIMILNYFLNNWFELLPYTDWSVILGNYGVNLYNARWSQKGATLHLLKRIHAYYITRILSLSRSDHSGYALSHWETTLHYNVVSNWLSSFLECSLNMVGEHQFNLGCLGRYGSTPHDDVIKWKHFPRSFDGFLLICAWTKYWVNDRDAGDLRRRRAHFDVTVMRHHDMPVHWNGEVVSATTLWSLVGLEVVIADMWAFSWYKSISIYLHTRIICWTL